MATPVVCAGPPPAMSLASRPQAAPENATIAQVLHDLIDAYLPQKTKHNIALGLAPTGLVPRLIKSFSSGLVPTGLEPSTMGLVPKGLAPALRGWAPQGLVPNNIANTGLAPARGSVPR